MSKERKRREIVHERSSHTIHTEIHTHAHLDQGLWLVSPKDPVFDLATYEEQVCLQLSPYPELHIKAFLEVGEKKGVTIFLGEETKKQKERSERTNWGARLCLILKIHKTQVSEQGRLRNLKFKSFQILITMISMVDT